MDKEIDSQSGFPLNPIESENLPISKKGSSIQVQPSQQVIDAPLGSGEAPYLYGKSAIPIEEDKKAPGFFETLGKTAWDMSLPRTAWNVGSNLYKDLTDHSPLPEGWVATDQKEYFENVPHKYWGSLADATSPKRQSEIYANILEEIKDNNYYAKGPFSAKILGGIPGFYMSGASLIKVAAFAKYNTMAESVLLNTRAAAPALTAQAVTMTAVEELGNAGTDAYEFATKTLEMMAFSGLLHGVSSSIGAMAHSRKLYDAKDVITKTADGVDFQAELNPDGSVNRYNAVGLDGKNLSAAETELYTSFINNRVNQSGLMSSKMLRDFLGSRAIGSTFFRMTNSRFPIVSEYIATITKPRFTTVGQKKGIASRITASEFQAEVANTGYQLSYKLEGLRYQALGLSDKVTFLNKKRANRIIAGTEEGEEHALATDNWAKDVRNAIEGNIVSKIPEVNQAATLLREFFDTVNKLYGRALGLNDVAFISTKNFLNYMPHVFDHEAIKLDYGTGVFIERTVAALESQDQKIMQLIDKRDAFQAQTKERYNTILENLKSVMRDDKFFKERQLTGDKTEHLKKEPEREFLEETKAIANEIATLKKSLAEINKQEKAMWDDLLLDESNNHLLENGEFFTKETRELGAQWLGKYSEIEQLVSALKGRSKGELKDIIKESKKAENKLYKSKSADKRIENQSDFRNKKYASEWVEAQLDKELATAETELRAERSRLIDEAKSGRMPRILYNLDKEGNFYFIDPHRAPELKQHFESYEDRLNYADQYRDRILGLTDEQTFESIFSGKGVGASQGTAYTKKRNRLIPYDTYNDVGFYTKNLTEMVMDYSNSMGKQIGLRMAFKENPAVGSLESIPEQLTKQYKAQLNEINNRDVIKSDSPYEPIKKRPLSAKEKAQQEKDRKKLEEDYTNAKKDINGIHEAYMGNGHRDYAGFARTFKLYASSAVMGGLPIAMTTEISQQISQFGLPAFLAEGLLTQVKTANGYFNTELRESMRNYASDAMVGMNVLKARIHMTQTAIGDSDIKVGGAVSRSVEFMGNAMGQISFANKITDVFHTLAAYMAQSRITRNMLDYAKNGKLDAREAEYMARSGLDVEKSHLAFNEQYKKYGKKEGRGHMSEYTQWDNLDAYSQMRRAVNRTVMSTHFEGSKYDNPLWANNPIASMIFQFNSWAFAAFNHITVPILQGPDGRQAFAMTLAIGLGALQEPMRAYINNREYKAPSAGKLAAIGVLNSGILGHFGNAINMANMAFGGNLLPGLLPQKYHDIGIMGAIGGVPGSMGDLAVGFAADLYTGKVTKQTVKKGQRLTPLIGAWQGRRLSNGIGEQIADYFGLPENSRGASGWGWWEAWKNANNDKD